MTAPFPVAGGPTLDGGSSRLGGKVGRDVASFYHWCDGDLSTQACRGLACFVARQRDPARWAKAEAQEPPAYCFGQCFAAPALGGDTVRPAVKVCAREGVILGGIARGGARSLERYVAQGGYRIFEQARLWPKNYLIAAVEESGLRGRGGAGYPTGKKWRAVAQQAAAEKFVVVNADEGDAGAYIDRFLLEDDPHRVLEGLLLAAHAVGARRGWIYLRGEYPRAAFILRTAIAEARAAGLLSQRVSGERQDFEIEVVIGQGSYICGEETALIRSIEGRRPEVNARPPYPTTQGLFGRPTLVNNVETLASVPWIAAHGGAAYAALGFSRSRGTKVVSLNSLFNSPGLYEIEFGVTVRHLVEQLGGGLRSGALQGVIIGGPLAGIIPPHLLDTPFGFEELQAIGAGVGHGGVVAFDQHTAIPELIHEVFSFGAHESCGKCTPCRLGSRRVEEIFAQILQQGPASAATKLEWTQLVAALEHASLCGLGTGLGDFARSILHHYQKELTPCFT